MLLRGKPFWFVQFILLALLGSPGVCNPAGAAIHGPIAGIFYDAIPGADPLFSREVAIEAESAGYEITIVNSEILTNAASLAEKNLDILVLPDAQRLPVEAIASLETWLARGGRLVAIGLPAWKDPVFLLASNAVTRSVYREAIASRTPEKTVENFDKANLARWARSSNNLKSGSRAELTQSERGRALHVTVENLTGWETLASPVYKNAFAKNQILTTFQVRADARTKQVAFEWDEKDGSRWIATVPVTKDWTRVVLTPGDFKAWLPPKGRGGPGDSFHPENAVRFITGLALTHTKIGEGRHEYWMDEIGTASHPFGNVALPRDPEPPRIEGISPPNTFRAVARPILVSTAAGIPWASGVTNLDLQVRASLRGADFSQPSLLVFQAVPATNATSRWIPLLSASSTNGEWKGAVAAMILRTGGSRGASIVASFTPGEPAFYRRPEIKTLLRETMRRLRTAAFFRSAGPDTSVVAVDRPVHFGARATRFGPEPKIGLTVRLKVLAEDGVTALHTQEWPASFGAEGEFLARQDWVHGLQNGRGCTAVFELIEGGVVLDVIQTKFWIGKQPKQPLAPKIR